MTKNNFITLAAALKATKPTNDAAMLEQWCNTAMAITEVCASLNPAFSKGKFLAACGVPNIMDK